MPSKLSTQHAMLSVLIMCMTKEYIIEKESVELPYIPVEYVFGESRAWNAIKLNRKKNKTDHAMNMHVHHV